MSHCQKVYLVQNLSLLVNSHGQSVTVFYRLSENVYVYNLRVSPFIKMKNNKTKIKHLVQCNYYLCFTFFPLISTEGQTKILKSFLCSVPSDNIITLASLLVRGLLIWFGTTIDDVFMSKISNSISTDTVVEISPVSLLGRDGGT